jgi:hypothetical protein
MTSYILLPRESLVSDIPAGDGNIEKLFYGVGLKNNNAIPASSDTVESMRNGR